MKSQNRADTAKWKRKRAHHLADRCGNPKCFICHSDKVCDVPDKQRIIAKIQEHEQIQEITHPKG